MGANMKVVNTTVTTGAYDGIAAGIRIAEGTVIDVPSGGALQTAIGAGNLTALTAQQTGGSPGVDDGLRNANTKSGAMPYNSGQN